MPGSNPSPETSQTPGGVEVVIGRDRTSVRLELRPVGNDWLLLITGGREHVGAAAVAGPEGGTGPAVRGTHREGPLATECAGIVAAATGRGCAAVAGIHQDEATSEEIAAIVANAVEGARILAAWAADPDQR